MIDDPDLILRTLKTVKNVWQPDKGGVYTVFL